MTTSPKAVYRSAWKIALEKEKRGGRRSPLMMKARPDNEPRQRKRDVDN
jgi:hypothetical protein